MRALFRDGWRYERADMFKCLALFGLLLSVYVGCAVGFAVQCGWPWWTFLLPAVAWCKGFYDGAERRQ